MTTTVRATYQNGVLLPDRPLPLAEGESVEVTLSSTGGEDEVLQQIKAAKSPEDLLAVLNTLPPDDGGYDVLAALNENRIWSGERPLFPIDGGTQ